MNKSLEVTRFFEKKITLVHRYKPHEARFCAARFFSGPKNRVSRGLAVFININLFLYINDQSALYSAMLLFLHLISNKIFFHPAKFDILKGETISDYKTVSVPQSQILTGLKTGGLVGLWATFEGSFFMFWGAKKIWCLEKMDLSPQNFCYDVLYPLYSDVAVIWIISWLIVYIDQLNTA